VHLRSRRLWSPWYSFALYESGSVPIIEISRPPEVLLQQMGLAKTSGNATIQRWKRHP
jgi:hypothetical protein